MPDRSEEALSHDSTTIQAELHGITDLDALIAGAREGRNAYIGRLFQLLAPNLRARLAPYSGELVDEVLSDTFLALPRALKTYTDTGRFDRWLHRVAFNIARTKTRSERRLAGRFGGDIEAALKDPSIIQTLTTDTMRELAMAALSPAEREVWYLFHQGYTREEVAETLGITMGAADVRMTRARRRLEPLKGLLE